ncbi:hypothetical protein F0562_033861 [Nyssa sinensis]|uniref:Uncharacterized protein n=1 Tax=Nyssa sinensis TaxID=561372 RepID=A0A5J5AFG3_9ASTE|nr:hypothetical protein F0562_033861 [Nyssa sinensis]
MRNRVQISLFRGGSTVRLSFSSSFLSPHGDEHLSLTIFFSRFKRGRRPLVRSNNLRFCLEMYKENG